VRELTRIWADYLNEVKAWFNKTVTELEIKLVKPNVIATILTVNNVYKPNSNVDWPCSE